MYFMCINMVVRLSTFSCIYHKTSMEWKSNGNIYRVTGLLCGEFTGHRWINLTKASDAELDAFFDLRLNKRLNKQSGRRWFETPSRPLWRHCHGLTRLDWDKRQSFCYISPHELCTSFVNCCAVLLFISGWIYPYRPGLLYVHSGNHMID